MRPADKVITGFLTLIALLLLYIAVPLRAKVEHIDLRVHANNVRVEVFASQLETITLQLERIETKIDKAAE